MWRFPGEVGGWPWTAPVILLCDWGPCILHPDTEPEYGHPRCMMRYISRRRLPGEDGIEYAVVATLEYKSWDK